MSKDLSPLQAAESLSPLIRASRLKAEKASFSVIILHNGMNCITNIANFARRFVRFSMTENPSKTC